MKRLLVNVLRHAVPAPDVGAFAPEPTHADAQRCQALLDAARERLKVARSARDRAVKELSAAEDRLRKALGVIDDSASADLASDDAEHAAQAATKAWAAAGCPDDGRPDRDILDRAAAARTTATDRRLLADGARDALPGLEETVGSARSHLQSAESGLRDAVRAVLIAKAEPEFIAMDRAALEFDAASRQVQGIAKALAGNFHQFSSAGASARLLSRLKDSMPAPPREGKALIYESPHLEADSWLTLARRLLEDPDAKE